MPGSIVNPGLVARRRCLARAVRRLGLDASLRRNPLPSTGGAVLDTCQADDGAGIVGADTARARNVLQHGIGAWVDRCDFSKLQDQANDQQLSTLAQDMRSRLVAMGSGQVLSFSQPFDE